MKNNLINSARTLLLLHFFILRQLIYKHWVLTWYAYVQLELHVKKIHHKLSLENVEIQTVEQGLFLCNIEAKSIVR